jgi:guanine deaminase
MADKDPKNLESYFNAAFAEAEKGISQKHGGPFGAVIVKDGKIIAKAHNTVLLKNDPTCHAETNAIRKACKKMGRPHIQDCILIASSEPCPMCFAVSEWADLRKIYFAVPEKMAAKLGFKDDFIYKDLGKPLKKRQAKEIHAKKFQEKGLEVFKNWKKLGGKLY